MVLYNGKYNWTAARNFRDILKGQELFEDSIVDLKYLLFDVNRMEKEELIEIANVVSSVFLLDQKVEDKEIVDRLKLDIQMKIGIYMLSFIINLTLFFNTNFPKFTSIFSYLYIVFNFDIKTYSILFYY